MEDQIFLLSDTIMIFICCCNGCIEFNFILGVKIYTLDREDRVS
jgi:hypothetical protein